MDEIIEELNSAKYISILDATSGYHQVPLNEVDMETRYSIGKNHITSLRE